MEKHTHYFYALRLPSMVKAELKQLCNQLKKDFPFQRWVHEEDYHITLAFLGFAPQDKLDKSIHLVKEALSNERSFSLMISNLGVFGRNDSPRIFWAGTEESEELHKIRDKVYRACSLAQFQLEKRPFSPHITLARKWYSDELFAHGNLKNIQFDPIKFIASEVVLYQTHLTKTPKYEAIEVFSLAR